MVSFDCQGSSSARGSVRHFIGKMQQLIVNGNELFELIRTGNDDTPKWPTRTEVGGASDEKDEVWAEFVGGQLEPTGGSIRPGTAVTFRSSAAYLVIKMRIHLMFSIYFKVCGISSYRRTTETFQTQQSFASAYF